MASGKRLIEEWMPIKEIGIECRRENSTGLHPAPNRLHVWWARRPLTASRATIISSLLPAWHGNEEILRKHFIDEDAYHTWVKVLLGIPAGEAGIDPVKTAEQIDMARLTGRNLGSNPYGYQRAFSRALGVEDIERFLNITADGNRLSVFDPMSGGGSIPFEALRLGLNAHASELNPVACTVLLGTLGYPLTYGLALIEDIKKWGARWGEAIESSLQGCYPLPVNENALGYLWARTVPCPDTGKPVPLSPNWWLKRQGNNSVAVRLLQCEDSWAECRFELVQGNQADLEAKYEISKGTVRRGNAISPWTGNPVSGDYIKDMAQHGKMGSQLYALCVNHGKGRDYRLPTARDIDGYRQAVTELSSRWENWIAKGLIPTEEILSGNKTDEPRRYGMYKWSDLFSPRQLLAQVTYLETMLDLSREMEVELGFEKAKAVRTYLGFVLDKCADYNNTLSSWDPTRDKVRNTFDRHDFSFKWSYAEMNLSLQADGAFPWLLSQVLDAYKSLCNLLEPSHPAFSAEGWNKKEPAKIMRANAMALTEIQPASIDAIVVDPPYGDNVMYAELSDFFYVWLKRSVGELYPEWFYTDLTDKQAEAVANPALFKGQKGNSRELATRDYLQKMRRAFREFRRVIKPDGAMTVMFTHRKTDMWNALGLALLETGWEIGASWPVNTESEHSLHQARKNSARSTIMLYVKPRRVQEEPSFWDQTLRQQICSVARDSAIQYESAGIDGVDLYLATYGPVLGVLSKSWPILSDEIDEETGNPRVIEPEQALTIARSEVLAYRKESLVRDGNADWDPFTEWYILSWDAFHAREFPFDEARKMAISTGINAADLINRHHILGRKADTVTLLAPRDRQGRGMVDPEAVTFTSLIDALHTAMWLYEVDGERESRRLLERTGYLRDSAFITLVGAAIRVIPRTKTFEKGQVKGFLVPEAEILERMRVTFFPDIDPPEDPSIDSLFEQSSFNMSEEQGEE